MRDWPHSPVHRLGPAGAYMVTAATYEKKKRFLSADRLDLLHDLLLTLAKQYEWRLQAWAVLANHYHFVASCGQDASNPKQFLRHLHSLTSREVNKMDGTPGRTVWFQYWDSQISFERSWLARLRYVHENAVHHGLVQNATDYRWCSAAWFERTATPSFYRTVMSFPIDRVNVEDDF